MRADWIGEPLSVAEEVLRRSLQAQRDRLVDKFAQCEPTIDALLALRSEAIVLERMTKDVRAECIEQARPPKQERTR